MFALLLQLDNTAFYDFIICFIFLIFAALYFIAKRDVEKKESELDSGGRYHPIVTIKRVDGIPSSIVGVSKSEEIVLTPQWSELSAHHSQLVSYRCPTCGAMIPDSELKSMSKGERILCSFCGATIGSA